MTCEHIHIHRFGDTVEQQVVMRECRCLDCSRSWRQFEMPTRMTRANVAAWESKRFAEVPRG